MDYLNARYYNSGYGRFTSEDPMFWGSQNLADPQSLNSYSYANNNPIVLSDPSGKCLWDLCIGEAVGAYALAYVGAGALTYLSVAAMAAYEGSIVYQTAKGYINHDQNALAQAGELASLQVGMAGVPAGSRVKSSYSAPEGYAFSQDSANYYFSNGQSAPYAGENLSSMADNIRAGQVVPVNYNFQGGVNVIENNRSAIANIAAGNSLNEVLVKGDVNSANRMNAHLYSNGLPQTGTQSITVNNLPNQTNQLLQSISNTLAKLSAMFASFNSK